MANSFAPPVLPASRPAPLGVASNCLAPPVLSASRPAPLGLPSNVDEAGSATGTGSASGAGSATGTGSVTGAGSAGGVNGLVQEVQPAREFRSHGAWDGAAADSMLLADAFSDLDALIRHFVDDLRHHEAVDWLDSRAAAGHVVVLYHCVRNLVKCSPSRVSGGVRGDAAAGAAASAAASAAAGGGVAGYAAGWLMRWIGGGGTGSGSGSGAGTGTGGGLLVPGEGGTGGGSRSRWVSGAWSGCRVMGSAEFRRSFALGVWLLVRCAQDVLAVAAVQGEVPVRGAVVYSMIRDKLFGWLLAQFPLSRFPALSDVLRDVRLLHEQSDGARAASATWCFRTGPSASARYLPWGAHIAFGDPGPHLSAACTRVSGAIAEERARVADLALRLLSSLTWEALSSAPLSLFL